MRGEEKVERQYIRVIEVVESKVCEELIGTVRKLIGDVLGTGPSIILIIVHSVSNLPPVTDPTDQRILRWVTEDPDLTDFHIGQRLGLSRQAVNTRRCKLKAMGYKVR